MFVDGQPKPSPLSSLRLLVAAVALAVEIVALYLLVGRGDCQHLHKYVHLAVLVLAVEVAAAVAAPVGAAVACCPAAHHAEHQNRNVPPKLLTFAN